MQMEGFVGNANAQKQVLSNLGPAPFFLLCLSLGMKLYQENKS